MEESVNLSHAQTRALLHVEEIARSNEPIWRTLSEEIVERAGCDSRDYDLAIAHLQRSPRVVLHFHPDRIGRPGITVARALSEEGVYRNQYETGISSGSLTAFSGGDRDRWEQELFGGAYHQDGSSPNERPKYGALEVIRFSDGPIPRFGSCYLVLKPHVKKRTSFTFMGSEHPHALGRLGIADLLTGVMHALLVEIEGGAMATPAWPPFKAPTLGVPNLTVRKLFDLLTAADRTTTRNLDLGRVLDTTIEAQVHGTISMADDVEEMVCDPSFRGTTTGEDLVKLSNFGNFALSWHPGYSLAAVDVPSDFRGPRMRPLAERIAGPLGVLDAATIGRAATSLIREPQLWSEWGPEAETLKHIQQLWHTLVMFGSPQEHAP
jgi:hypothetical protein